MLRRGAKGQNSMVLGVFSEPKPQGGTRAVSLGAGREGSRKIHPPLAIHGAPVQSGPPMKITSLALAMSFLSAFSFAKADPLKVGDQAPSVSGTTDAGTSIDLGAVYKQQPYTLVYFYPKAGTSGCTKQGCSLRDAYEALSKKGVVVIGVSHDTVAEQKAFKDENHFPFTLIADKDKAVSKAFGVPDMKLMGLATRQAYLIKDGKVVWADYKASTTQQADDVLKALAAQGS